MARVQLRAPVERVVQAKIHTKPRLMVDECDCCGKIFEMGTAMWDGNVAELTGIFDKCPGSQGNMFDATVCSFECAGELFRGGWRDLEDYQPYVDAGATLLRGAVRITVEVKYEQELIQEWEELPESDPRTFGGSVRFLHEDE